MSRRFVSSAARLQETADSHAPAKFGFAGARGLSPARIGFKPVPFSGFWYDRIDSADPRGGNAHNIQVDLHNMLCGMRGRTTLCQSNYSR
jgi:hypothetical protein